MKSEDLTHTPYTNARGEYIDNGTDRNVWCDWWHRPECPLCRAMPGGEVRDVTEEVERERTR